MRTSLVFSVALLAAGAALGGTAPARADDLIVYVAGQLQGQIRSWYNPVTTIGGVDVSQGGWVEDLSWFVNSPRDPASGLPTGKRLHHPLTLRLRMSAATLLLANALVANENLPEVKVQWFEAGADGEKGLARELVLRNANIASFSTYTVHADGTGLTSFVDVSFTYQKIGIHHMEGGISFEDDWETPAQ